MSNVPAWLLGRGCRLERSRELLLRQACSSPVPRHTTARSLPETTRPGLATFLARPTPANTHPGQTSRSAPHPGAGGWPLGSRAGSTAWESGDQQVTLPQGNGHCCSQGEQPPPAAAPESGGAVDRAGGALTRHPAHVPPHHGRAMLTSLIPDAWWAPSKLNPPRVPCSASCWWKKEGFPPSFASSFLF